MQKKKPITFRQELPAKAFWKPEQLREIFHALEKKYKRKEATKRFCKIFAAATSKSKDGMPNKFLSKSEECVVFGLTSMAGAATLFHIMLPTGEHLHQSRLCFLALHIQKLFFPNLKLLDSF